MEVEEWSEEFEKLNDEQLVERWQGDLGKSGWVYSHGTFLYALQRELERRGLTSTAQRAAVEVLIEKGPKCGLDIC